MKIKVENIFKKYENYDEVTSKLENETSKKKIVVIEIKITMSRLNSRLDIAK